MLNYKIEGQGSPLLLLHGWGVTFTIWRNLVPLLSPHFQLVMVELPGFGSSAQPDPSISYYNTCASEVENLRVELGFTSWDVLSYSMGTRALEPILRKYPETVPHAIFLCPAVCDTAHALSLRIFGGLDSISPLAGDFILSGARLHGLVVLLGFNGINHPYAREWTREISSQPLDVLKAALRDLPDKGTARLDYPDIPSLFIWGKTDIIVSRPRHPGKHDRIISANHSAPMCAAPAVADAVLQFLSYNVK